MGTEKYFLDNEVYGADDVNKALSRLTTAGVGLFNDTGSFDADLNEAISNVTSVGVDSYNSESCRVVCSDGVYSVSKGVCFLSDGSSIVIDENGYVLDVPSGEACYVYVERNNSLNDILITVSSEAGGTDTVPLAKIGADGRITDNRVFAKAKIALATSNFTAEKTFSLTFKEAEYTETEIDVGYAGFNLIWIIRDDESQCTDISDGEMHYTGINGFNTRLYCKKSGSKIIFRTISWASGDVTAEITIKLY